MTDPAAFFRPPVPIFLRSPLVPKYLTFWHQMSKYPNSSLQASVLEPIQIVRVRESGFDTKSSGILTPTTFCRLNRKIRLPQKNIKSAFCGLPRGSKSAFQALYFGPCGRSAELSQTSIISMTYEDKKIPRDDEVVVGYWNCLVEHIGVEPMTSCMPCRRSSQLS